MSLFSWLFGHARLLAERNYYRAALGLSEAGRLDAERRAQRWERVAREVSARLDEERRVRFGVVVAARVN